MRLIDANALYAKAAKREEEAMEALLKCDANKDHELWIILNKSLIKETTFKFDIADAPTIEERKTGRWIWEDEGYHCSECLFHAYGDTLSCLDGTFKYCPHCGAKMESPDEEEEGVDDAAN